MTTPKILESLFQIKPQGGWIALTAHHPDIVAGYRTQRIAKLTPDGELQFTIGATRLGQSIHLNRTIKNVLQTEELEVLERTTTSGSREYESPYPTVRLTELNDDSLIRIVHRIEGAILQGGMA